MNKTDQPKTAETAWGSTKQLLISEFNLVIHYAPFLSTFIFPKKDNIFEWDCFVMIKEGFYEKGIFRFIIHFKKTYPKEIPTIVFKTEVFHPLISDKGELDLAQIFPNWKIELGK